MPLYVDGFVVPVPKKKVEEYRQLAKKASKVWRDYGAVVAQAAGPREREGHEGPAHHRDDGGQEPAVRSEANDLRRIHDARRAVKRFEP